jgi:hypothetical protein
MCKNSGFKTKNMYFGPFELNPFSMKKTLLSLGLLALVALLSPAQAQYYYLPGSTNGNPGNLNADSEYPVGGGLATTWTTISTASATSPTWTAAQTLPFSFQFNGTAVTQYKVSTSGVLTFDVNAATAPSYTKAALPNAGIPDNSVCIWGLAAPGTNDLIVTKTFGTAPNRQHWIMFSSFGIPGNTCWTYWAMALEESTNKIYIVDQRNSCTGATFSMGIQVNSTTAYSVNGSPNVAAQAGTDATPADNKYYEFIPGTQPANNLVATSLNVADYLVLGQAPFTVAANYLNGGSNAVTSATLNYKVNNGATVSGAASGVNIASATSGTLTHPTAWTPASTGTYTLKFWTSNPNGQTDAAPQNDTVTKQVVVVGSIAVRKPLIEVFSSSTCAPCAPANATFKTLMDAQPVGDYNYIKYQMSWPGTGDPYYTAEGGSKRTLYSVSSVPNAQIDGGWNGHAGQITQAILNNYKAVPAFVNLSGFYTVDAATQKVDMQIDMTPLVSTSKSLSLQVAIYEKSTTQNVKSNGETVFYKVMKKMVPDANGTVLNGLAANVAQSKTLSYTFNGAYTLPANASAPVNHATAHTVEDFTDLGVMVWIQDMATKEIYQSANLTSSGVSLEENTLNAFSIAPNPAQNTVSFQFGDRTEGSFRVLNTLGQVVFAGNLNGENTATLNISDWNNGLYVVEFTNGTEQSSQRFQVAH